MEENKNIENVHVSIRIRNSEKIETKNSNQFQIKNNTIIDNSNQKEFTFDNVFQENSSQEEVFDKVGKEIISKVIEGYNSTIFAYGTTGCLHPNTKVLIYSPSNSNKTKKIKHITKEDILIGDDKTPRRIFRLIHGYSKLYKINQKHSKPYIVNEDHILVLKNKKDSNILEISLKNLLSSMNLLKNYYGYSVNFSNFSYKLTPIEIEYYGYGEYYGFTLDGNQRFLLSDYTVTHNSGKTFTMFGNENNSGIIPRCCDTIFNLINNKEEVISAKLECSFLEIYKENMRDLLNIKCKDPLRIRTKNKNNYLLEINSNINQETKSETIFVEGLTKNLVYSTEDIINLISQGTKNRVIASTNLNDVSSRSHVIISLYLTQILKNSEIVSKLHLIDLAGSENVGKSGVQGNNLIEAQTINKSLSCLGNVIYALSEKNRDHIPYRDSRLTYLLKDSLGGNCKTHIIITINTKNSYSENINSLRFGQRAKLIKNIPIINKNDSVESLQLQIIELNKKLSEYIEKYENSNRLIEELKKVENKVVDETKIIELKDQNQNLEKQLLIYKNENQNLVSKIKEKEEKEKKLKEFLIQKEDVFKKQRDFSDKIAKELYKEAKEKNSLKNELYLFKIFFDTISNTKEDIDKNIIKKLVSKNSLKISTKHFNDNFIIPEIDSP